MASLAASALVLAFVAPLACLLLLPRLTAFLAAPESMTIDITALAAAAVALLMPVAAALAPMLLPIAAAVVLAAVGQVGLVWAPAKVAPKAANLSLRKGLQRMASLPALVEFLKGLAKLTAVGMVAALACRPLLQEVEALAQLPLPALADRAHHVAIMLVLVTAAVMCAVAAFDYGFQRLNFLKQMRMTRQELRDEYKDSEGDPQVKARIRRIRADRARRRMMAAVPKATVVITNPTHFAVALLYEAATMAAPKVVAKGTDAVAQRIRDIAENHGVPIVENPPLARSLFATVDVDAEIPPQHYKAVAGVISYLVQCGRLRRAA